MYQDEEYVYTIVNSTPNSGSYLWLIPDTLTQGANYVIMVSNANDGTIFSNSGVFTVLNFAPPENVVSSDVSNCKVSVSWDSVEEIDGYYLFRSDSGSPFVVLDSLGTAVTAYIDINLTGSTQYCYKLASRKSGYVSDYSDTTCLQTIEDPNTLFVLSDNEVCLGDTIALTYFSDCSIYDSCLWSFGADATVIEFPAYDYQLYWTSSGSKVISYEIIDGCGHLFTSQDNILVHQPPVLSPIEGDTIVCANQSDVIYFTESTNSNSFFWEIDGGEIVSGQETNSINVHWLSNTEPGFVKLTVNSEAGCDATSPDYIVNISSNTAPDKSHIALKGANLLICSDNTQGCSYQWYYNNSKIEGETDQYYNAIPFYPDGPYSVVISYGNDCETKSYEYPENLNEIDNYRALDNYKLFPNPSSGSFTIKIDNDYLGKISLAIYTSLGKQVFYKSDKKHANIYTDVLNVEYIPNGYYLLEVSFGNQFRKQFKIIIN